MKTLALVTFTLLAFTKAEDECKANGFFRNSEDCTRFYRCVDLTGRGYFQKYTFSCPVGTVFDENVQVCNHKWAAPPCENKMEEGEGDKQEEEEDSVNLHPILDLLLY